MNNYMVFFIRNLLGDFVDMKEWFAKLAEDFSRCFIEENRYMMLIDGIGVTIKVSLVAVAIGIVIGFLIAM